MVNISTWYQVHNIWRKKKERAEKKMVKEEACSLWKQKKKSTPLFSVPWEEPFLPKALSWTYMYLLFANWNQPYVSLPQRQTRHACMTFAGQTFLPGKPRELTGTSAPEGEWTYNCLIGQYLYKWFVWDSHRCCCKSCFSWIWPCSGYYRIMEIVWHKSVLCED